MNNEEVKQALANGKPVIYFVPLVGDVNYDRVSIGYLVKSYKKRCTTYRKNNCYFIGEVKE